VNRACDQLLPRPGLTEDEIIAELGKLKAAKLLHGFRNSPPVDVKAVADAAVALGRLMRARPDITEVDINPLMVHAAGQGATVLDALIVTDTARAQPAVA
jgi:succinyl-CoA synthetase beta subunit